MAQNNDPIQRLIDSLWKIYWRKERPIPFQFNSGNLPWDDNTFSQRMLHEHLDESHGAASRQRAEREAQIEWLWEKLNLSADSHLFDITCGPGLYAIEFAKRNCTVTGNDFAPASLAHAQILSEQMGVADRCKFLHEDIRAMTHDGQNYDAAILLYGQLAVMSKADAQTVLQKIYNSLRKGGTLCLEMLNPAYVDKEASTWWFTDESGLWGDEPFLHLGERFWEAEQKVSVERYNILQLSTGKLEQIELADQVYEEDEIAAMLKSADFSSVTIYSAWDMLPLNDAQEWIIYIATK